MPVSQPLLDFFDFPDGTALKLCSVFLKASVFQYSTCQAFSLLASFTVSPGRPQRLVPALFPGFTCRIMTPVFSAGKLSSDVGLVLPTPKRWKRLVLSGSMEPRGVVDAPPHLFFDQGSVDTVVSNTSDLLPHGKAVGRFQSRGAP